MHHLVRAGRGPGRGLRRLQPGKAQGAVVRAIRAVAGITALCCLRPDRAGCARAQHQLGPVLSGLAACYGHLVPLPGDIPASAGYAYWQVMLEWVHRLIAGVAVGPLVLVLWPLTWLRRHERPRLLLGGIVLLMLLLLQGALGGAHRAGPQQPLVSGPAPGQRAPGALDHPAHLRARSGRADRTGRAWRSAWPAVSGHWPSRP